LRHFFGSLSGVLNMANNLGGAISPVMTPLIAKHFGWTAALDVGAIVILSMGSLWFLVHPERSIDPV
jgi:ACS family glucarate transporter-like MFS transporter